MTDPISAAAAAVSIGHDFWRFVGFLRGVAGADVISALFKWDATRVIGSDKIEVHKHRPNEAAPEAWFYEIAGLNDYTFLRFPVVQSGIYELIGQEADKKNPDSRFWRWVAEPQRSVLYGANLPPNALVDFVIVGYRPKALIRYVSSAV